MNAILWKLMNLRNRMRGLRAWLGNALLNHVAPEARLFALVTRADGRVEDLGLISTRVVTTAAANYIVDSFQNSTSTPLDAFKYHGCGTGTGDEAVGDTALGTETGSRVSGTQVEGASANIYRTVATISFTTSLAITEHGVFSASSSGTLLDRSKFAAINVANGDSIQFTYELTVTAGG